jgi:IS30 family transposase
MAGRGTANHKAVLDDEKVRQIRKLRQVGYSMLEIAVEYNVTNSTVSRILSRDLWGHVKGEPKMPEEVECSE